MTKTSEQITAAGVVCRYQADTIRSINALDTWYTQQLSAEDIDIVYLEIFNSTERFSEGGCFFEFLSTQLPASISKSVRDICADGVLLRVSFQDAEFSICIRIGEWIASISSSQKNHDKFDALAAYLSL
jgi:hypothetical protein